MRGTGYVFDQLGSGVNLEASPYSVDNGQAKNALNVRGTPNGGWRKRYGFSHFSTLAVSSGDRLTSLFGLNLSSKFLVSAAGTALYKITSAGVSSTIKTGLTQNKIWSFIQAPAITTQGPLYAMNGVDTPQQWDGVAATTSNWTASSGTLPNGKFLLYFANRVFVSGVSGFPNHLYWSDIADPTVWLSPAGGNTQFDPSDGQEITGMGKCGPYIMMFKPRKTYRVTNTDSGAYEAVSNSIGCIASKTIVDTDKGCFFLSRDNGVMVTNGSTIEPISKEVMPLFRGMSATNAYKATAVYIDNRYYISIPANGTVDNSMILEYDTVAQSWWIHQIYFDATTTTGVADWAIMDPSITSTLFSGAPMSQSATNVRVHTAFDKSTFKDGISTSTTYNYPAFWESGWHTFGQPHIRKRCRQIRVDAAGEYTVSTARSFRTAQTLEDATVWEAAEDSGTFGGAGTFGGTGTFGGGSTVNEKHYRSPGVARAWSVRFDSVTPGTVDNTGTDLELYSYTMAMQQRTN